MGAHAGMIVERPVTGTGPREFSGGESRELSSRGTGIGEPGKLCRVPLAPGVHEASLNPNFHGHPVLRSEEESARPDSSLLKRFRSFWIGGALDPSKPGTYHQISLIAFFAWVGLGSDGLSSSSYGPEEAFI